ncbi:hypothetical protein GCM10011497_25710 [Elstera cyanobacteriorum]|nr:MFS transporter [Elstera cyanobacteriorum]GFZ94393.1 hypothetical protein GCM10011497_25710 [Elstera cyanobacteriorum]
MKVAAILNRLAAGSLLIGLGQGAQFALLPLIVAMTGLSPALLGGIVGGGTLVGLLGALLWGRMADRQGYRRVAVWAVAVYAAAQALMLLALFGAQQDWLTAAGVAAWIAVVRLAHGFSVAGIQPVLQGWCGVLTDAAGRFAGLAKLSAALSLGRLVGPLLATAAILSPLLPFGLVALLALPILAVIIRLPDPVVTPALPAERRRLRPDRALAVGFLMTLALGQIYATLGLYLQARDGLTAEAAAGGMGLSLSLAALAALGLQTLVLPRLALTPRLTRPGQIAAIALGLGCLVPLWLRGIVGAALGASLISLGATLLAAITATRVSLGAGPGQHGRVAGGQSAAQNLGYAAGAAAGGVLFQIAPAAPLIAAAACAVALLLLESLPAAAKPLLPP